MKGLTYQRMKNWCERNGVSISGLIEDIVEKRMNEEGEPVPTEVAPKPVKAPVDVDKISSQHFTF